MDKETFAKAHIKQTHGVCVLASYAVAASAHTCSSPQEFMEAYCRGSGHDIDSAEQAQQRVSETWDVDADAAGRNGFQHLVHVHSTFKQEPFKTASRTFKLKPLPGSNAVEEIKSALRQNPNVTAILALHPKTGPAHAIAVGYDEKTGGFLISDPTHADVEGPFSAFPAINDDAAKAPMGLGEGFLLEPVQSAS